MKNKPRPLLFAIALILSVTGWVCYTWLSIIMDRREHLDITAFIKKYFSGFPGWLSGPYQMGMVIWVVLAIAIILILVSGFLSSKFKIFSLITLVLDVLILNMSFMLFL